MTDAHPPPAPTLLELAKPIFLAWEKLRLFYILILGLWTAALAAPLVIADPILIVVLVAAGVAANLCYFLGPAVETYIRWLGYERAWVRVTLFVSGTLWTGLLALVFVVSIMFPGWM